MMKHHPQEFKKNKCTMISQILIMELYVFLIIVSNILKDESRCICCEENKFIKYLTLASSFFNMLDMHTTLFAFVVLYVKSSDDIL